MPGSNGIPGFGGGFGGGFAGGSAGRVGGSTTVDDLFDTSPPARPEPQRPVSVSPEMRMRLVGRIQDLRLEHRGDPPGMAADKRERLEAALASGDAVEVKLSQGGLGQSAVSAVLKKSDDLEASTSFFLKKSGGFAGVQFFGPFDL